MRLGLQIPWFTWPGGAERLGPTLARIAQDADKAGFYSLWVMDHFFQIPPVGPAENDMLEGYSALSFMAAHTRRVKLGTMVTGVTYRQPAVLVKTVTTLDVLSGGRAYFGIGAAWFDREHEGLGVPFPPVKERFERLEETLQIALQMWSGKVAPYHGKHYQLAETLCVPQPLQKPHPPILIGGAGEKKTLRLVAQYADACNIFTFMGEDVVRQKLAVLKEHCQAVGRPYEHIEKTGLAQLKLSKTGGGGFMSPAQAVDWLLRWQELGITHMIFGLADVDRPETMELMATDVIPYVGGVKIAG